MHDSQEILRLLARLSLHYPQSGRTAAELAALSLDLAEDLAPFPLAVIERGMVYARRECRWFPSTAQLVDFCAKAMGELRRFEQQKALRAPEPDWEENALRGLRWCEVIRERLRRPS